MHITDSEANSYVRCRHFIAQPGSHISAYDEMVWAGALGYHNQAPEDAVELFRWLRGNTYKLIAALGMTSDLDLSTDFCNPDECEIETRTRKKKPLRD